DPARDCKSTGIARKSSNNDACRAGCFRGHGCREAVLAGALNQNAAAKTHTTVFASQFDAVGERQERGSQGSRNVLRQSVDDGARMDVQILAVAAPQSGFDLEQRGPIAQRSSARTAGRERAIAEMLGAAPATRAAGDIFLEGDPVAFAQPPPL